ncbi:hypothetical protein KUL156_40110 [Alteromonas sp. KUL156]|nr:hypothetical protein KUL154_09000 [Alteromonas sp. KUL154]GFE01419.1 hypothetical protein KUL156_40110 [Alteromonas sp. KUL156]
MVILAINNIYLEFKMKEKLIEIEKQVDKEILELKIYELPFQSVYTYLLFNANYIGDPNISDDTVNYLMRVPHIYKLIKGKCLKDKVQTPNKVFLKLNKSHIDDINFLNSYAHFSLLMPQIYRGTLEVKSIVGRKIELDYKDDQVKMSELIDKLYTTLSLPINFKTPSYKELVDFIKYKFDNDDLGFTGLDYGYIEKLYREHCRIFFFVNVLEDKVLNENLGFDNSDYIKFISSMKAYADYLISILTNIEEKFKEDISDEEKDLLTELQINTSAKCMDYEALKVLVKVSELDEVKFFNILSYFIDVYSNSTGREIEVNSFVGDGYQPPFIFFDDHVIFSPHSLRYFFSFNNVLFSINKTNQKLFNNKLSSGLEPVLLDQMEYLFKSFEGLEVRKEVLYDGGEVDLIVLSEKEKVCLAFQVKTTITPSNSRMVARVQDRVLEAKKQIDNFEEIDMSQKIGLINKAFGVDMQEIKIINLILMRSSAGAELGWEINKSCKILNYSFLASILCKKLTNKELAFKNFEDEISLAQKELIDDSNWSVNYEEIEIGGYKISFPDISFDDGKVVPKGIKPFKCFKEMESAKFQ